MDQIPPDFELTAFRFTTGLIFSLVYLSVKQKLPRIEKSNMKWVVAKICFSISYNVLIYNHFLKSITFVGIQGILKSMNIVYSLILSKIFLNVKISVPKALTAMIVLGGLAVILAAQYLEQTTCSVESGEIINICQLLLRLVKQLLPWLDP